MKDGSLRIAADIGGTFTDVVVTTGEKDESRVGKVLSTPTDFSQGVLAGIEAVIEDFSRIDFLIHGTTAGLNNFLERKGARTALVTTKGFRDVYEIARANRPEMYDLFYRRPTPLVPRRDVFELAERILANGKVECPLDADAVESLADRLRAGGYTAIAVVLLHSYVNPEHELLVERVLLERLDGVSISVSHRVAREYREYERTSSTVINAYIAPVMERYLTALGRELASRGYERSVYIMRSGGGSMTSERAKTESIHTLMSGPVGGTVACRLLGRNLGETHLICADMGGTSLDVSLVIDGEVDLETQGWLEGFPILAPMVRIHSLGAGGGSLAKADGRALRVGPESAGADPGPACYGRGGEQATVTDANVVTGRIVPALFLGGRMPLDEQAARDSVTRLADGLSLALEEAAEGILGVINSVMANAIRTLTIEKGWDPREFAIVAYGGAGPLHAAFLAQELQIGKVIVPASPGTFSARGMLSTDMRHDLVRPVLAPLGGVDPLELQGIFEELEAEARAALADQGVSEREVIPVRSADIRYVGQEYFVNMPCPTPLDGGAVTGLLHEFHRSYEHRYGHSNPLEDTEVVNLRLAGIGRVARPETPRGTSADEGEAIPSGYLRALFDGETIDTPVYVRGELGAGVALRGPAVVLEDYCTTAVPPGFDLEVDGWLNLILARGLENA